MNDEHKTTEDWLPTSVSPLVNNWLFRQGRSVSLNGKSSFEELERNSNPGTPCSLRKCLTTAWWARSDYFNQSLATLGGGDLSVVAGGSIRNIYASTATNAFLGENSPIASLNENGGGDLRIYATGDIAGAAIYVQKGKAGHAATGVAQRGRGGGVPGPRRREAPLCKLRCAVRAARGDRNGRATRSGARPSAARHPEDHAHGLRRQGSGACGPTR